MAKLIKMFNKNRLRRLREIVFFYFLILLLVGVFLLISQAAEARAGGGHYYSTGRGSRSSDASSGGSIPFDLIIMLIRLIIYYPVIGIPITILVVFIIIQGYNKGNDAWVNYTIVKGVKVTPENQAAIALTELKKRDPGFDEDLFKQRVGKAFEIIQKAWSERNLNDAQYFLSDGVFEQFNIQIDEMKENNIIDHIEDLKILSLKPIKFQSDKHFDVIHLRIDAQAINYRIDEKTGKIIDGSRFPENFAEVWSFLRRPGVRTSKKPGLIEGQCPNCGNPIKIGRLAKCEVCNSLLRSGEHDWVLAGITQACEWSLRSDHKVLGFAEMVEADSGFNIQHLKDRIAVMFWRKLQAERIGNAAPLRKIACNEFCDAQQQWYKPDNTGARRFYTSCALGAINLLGIELAEPDNQIYAEVIWSGLPTILRKNKKIETAQRPINFKHVFILGRKHGVKTRLNASLSSTQCPSCGAPEQNSTENECPYCGTVMNDGSTDWVLEAVVDRTDPELIAVLKKLNQSYQSAAKQRQVYPQPSTVSQEDTALFFQYGVSGLELVKWAVAMMLADRQIDPKELKMLDTIAKQCDVSSSRLQNIINELKLEADPVDVVMRTTTLPVNNELIRKLVRVALSDGRLSAEEMAMLAQVGQRIGMMPTDIDLLIKSERLNLYQEAKMAIRQAKRNKYN